MWKLDNKVLVNSVSHCIVYMSVKSTYFVCSEVCKSVSTVCLVSGKKGHRQAQTRWSLYLTGVEICYFLCVFRTQLLQSDHIRQPLLDSCYLFCLRITISSAIGIQIFPWTCCVVLVLKNTFQTLCRPSK